MIVMRSCFLYCVTCFSTYEIFCAATSTPTTNPPTKDTPQRVQIMRTPDGRITVKGLLPGQQLVQYPDGKLQVLTTAQLQSSGLTTTKTPITATTPKAIIKQAVNTSAGKTLVQANQLKTVVAQPQVQQSPIKTQQVVVKQQQPIMQKVAQGSVVVGTTGQVIQQQVVLGSNQVIASQGGQQVRLLKNICFYISTRLSSMELA